MNTTIQVEEVTLFFHSYGLKCEKEVVKAWLDEEKSKSDNSIINEQINVNEDYIYSFNDWCRWKGTAYEE